MRELFTSFLGRQHETDHVIAGVRPSLVGKFVQKASHFTDYPLRLKHQLYRRLEGGEVFDEYV